MGRWLLVATLCTACHFYRVPHEAVAMVSQDDVDDLEADVAQQTRCPEDQVESRELTLLLREVRGCGSDRIYAWDDRHEQWVLAAVQ
jgi:hypothetical protein